MSTEKRDMLANSTALVLPTALSDIDSALDAIDHGKVSEGVTQITEALARLRVLVPMFDAACAEARGEA